ncbi:hypothetical protein [Streptomyces minutiscleroticus]|uniref:Uncharacterized protein n=1 Tax=Streptomyces minutiscleroticus TaxID=68238 RepID=A0A918KET4_9ACTN|nr:hypothetical protein [Streptomyces minutiscleroticus]GGX60736.1 hypothetical protein GCM10010358_14120 [Streptomyces minutiscleroticus]
MEEETTVDVLALQILEVDDEPDQGVCVDAMCPILTLGSDSCEVAAE